MNDNDRKAYRFHENIAAISADVHADDRLSTHIDRTEESFPDRLAWIIDAAKALSTQEPSGGYEEDDLDWYEVTGDIADGYYAGLSPNDAVEKALDPTPPQPQRTLERAEQTAKREAAACHIPQWVYTNGRDHFVTDTYAFYPDEKPVCRYDPSGLRVAAEGGAQ